MIPVLTSNSFSTGSTGEEEEEEEKEEEATILGPAPAPRGVTKHLQSRKRAASRRGLRVSERGMVKSMETCFAARVLTAWRNFVISTARKI